MNDKSKKKTLKIQDEKLYNLHNQDRIHVQGHRTRFETFQTTGVNSILNFVSTNLACCGLE